MAYLTDPQVRTDYYVHIHGSKGKRNWPRWRGIHVVKLPQDLILYAQVIQKRTPDFIIETGTKWGGSALFFGDMLMLSGGRRVFSIDTKADGQPPHPMVTYLNGSSTDPKIFDQMKRSVEGKGSVMVVLDSDHRKEHVLKELELYSTLVTRGQYLVVEDCWTKRGDRPYPPYYAIKEFLKDNSRYFRLMEIEKQFIYAITRGGWLIKR